MKTKEIILLVLLVIMTILSVQQFQSLGGPSRVDGLVILSYGGFSGVCIALWGIFIGYLIVKKDKSWDPEKEILTMENLKGTGCVMIIILLLVGFVWFANWNREQHTYRHLPERGKLESIETSTRFEDGWAIDVQTLLVVDGKEYRFNCYGVALQIDGELENKMREGKFKDSFVVIKRMGKKTIPPWKYEREVILLLLDEPTEKNNSGGGEK